MGMQQSQLLMHKLIERSAVVAPNEEIVTATEDGVRRQNYRDTRKRSHQLAHALASAGIGIGDRVGTFMWNGSRHLEAYWASAGMGCVLHTINIRLGPKDLEYIINHAGAEIIIVDADLLPALDALKGVLAKVRQIVVAAEPGFEDWTTNFGNAIDYEDFIAGQPEEYVWPEIPETSALGLCYTSGTTGDPKGVEYEHRSQYLHTFAQSLTDSMGLSSTDTLCGIVPMFHAQGWGLPWAATMLGMKQVMPHRFMGADRLIKLMSDEGVTISAGVPTIWQGVKSIMEAQPGVYDLSKLERLTCGGSAPPLSLIAWYWEDHQVEMVQGWGMTETSPLGTLSRRFAKRSQLSADPQMLVQNQAKAGQLMPGLEMKIVDDEFNELPWDGEAVGEVLIRGPWIAREYYKNPQPDKFNDGWLVTGDVAKIDPEAYLIIADRSKDLIKSGGEWISSVDLENHIVGYPGVAQACVVAAPHPKWDERPIALVVLADGVDVEPESIIRHCDSAYAKWQLPDEVLFVDSIPHTGTGKMDKKIVRANLESSGYVLPDLRDS